MANNRINLFFLLVFGFVSAYPYMDFVHQSYYLSPVPPSDSILGRNCVELPIAADFCNLIQTDPNLTMKEKKGILLSALNPNSDFPQFDAVKNWNDKLVYSKYPLKPAITKGSIHDAWVKIITLYPSVLENGTLLLNTTGNIRSEFGFSYVLPDDPPIGECGYVYQPIGYDYNLSTYLNGKKINKNNEKISSYSLVNKQNTFSSELTIEAAYKVLYFRTHTTCTTDTDGGKACSTSCDYEGTDTFVNKLTLSDSKQAQLYDFSYNISSFVDGNFSGLYDLWLSFDVPSDYSQIVFDSENAHLISHGMTYYFTTENEGFNTIILAAQEDKTAQTYHFSILNQTSSENETRVHAYTLASDACDLTLYTHFNKNHILNVCNQTGLNSTITVNLLNQSNETFSIKIRLFDNMTNASLEGRTLDVKYANKEQKIITDANGEAIAEFNYILGHNTVETVFSTDFIYKSSRAIFIFPSQLLDLKDILFKIALIICFLLILINVVKKGVNYAR